MEDQSFRHIGQFRPGEGGKVLTKSGPDAQTWLGNRALAIYGGHGVALPPLPLENKSYFSPQEFQAKQFLLPGWKGEGLRSKSLFQMQGMIQEFSEEAKENLNPQHFSRQNKALILEDLRSFLSSQDLELELELDPNLLWDSLWENDGPLRAHIDSFLKDFIAKSVFLSLLKIYCSYNALPSCSENARTQALSQAHNCLANLFARPGARPGNWDFNLESLRLNQFTWFRPSHSLLKKLLSLIAEEWGMLEIDWIRLLNNDKCPTSPLTWTQRLNFLQTLSIDFPHWLDEKGNKTQRIPAMSFTGDQVENFFWGHWADMQFIKEEKASSRPVFFDFPETHDGRFLKLVHELLQISFYSRKAKKLNLRPSEYIGQLFKDTEVKVKSSGQAQTSLFGSDSVSSIRMWENITLNLCDFPKNNPHFHLVTQISRYKEMLISGGRLMVLTHRKLFVPSQSEKVNGLLQSLKLEATFNLDSLKGRGDLAPFVYIFSKKNLGEEVPRLPAMSKGISIPSPVRKEKQSILSFRFSGELSHSGGLKIFTEQLKSFFEKRSPDSTTLYQIECDPNLNFEFYLDAIVDGKLINSTSKDQSKITHPHFFRGLWKTCHSLEDCLQIEQIDTSTAHQKWPATRDLLGLGSTPQERFQYILIVDQRISAKTRLEIIPAESFPVKKEEYGVSLCTYFGAIPKKSGTNVNLLRAYFNGPIGSQQVAMALSGNMSKIKGRLRTLLIPKFFTEIKDVPQKLAKIIEKLPQNKQQVKIISGSSLRNLLGNLLLDLHPYCVEYPQAVLSALCQTQFALREAIVDIHSKKFDDAHFFSNPLVIQGIQKLENYTIYPKHPDLFLDFKSSGVDSLKLLYSHCEKQEGKENGISELIIHSDLGPVFGLHGPEQLLDFCHYVLRAAEGHSCFSILQGLRAPRAESLKGLLSLHDSVGEEISQLYTEIDSMIQQLLRKQLVGSELT